MARVKWRDGYLNSKDQVRALAGKPNPSKQVSFTELEGFDLVVFRINARWVWGAVDWASGGRTHRGEERFDTKDAAMRAAESFARANSKPVEGETRG